ncbi:MAG TPA: hypothetical protein VHI76_01450 [Solirubrobacterales bacterium]|nr:hypothetical protein [Solirubrobacterales bacterium]
MINAWFAVVTAIAGWPLAAPRARGRAQRRAPRRRDDEDQEHAARLRLASRRATVTADSRANPDPTTVERCVRLMPTS